MNRVNRIIDSRRTQPQPLDVRWAGFQGNPPPPLLSLSLCQFSFPDIHLTQKSIVITQARHRAAPTNSTLSEIEDHCLAVQRISEALLELRTSLISTERKQHQKLNLNVSRRVNEKHFSATVRHNVLEVSMCLWRLCLRKDPTQVIGLQTHQKYFRSWIFCFRHSITLVWVRVHFT